MELARLISKMMNDGKKEVVFAVGDAEGFSKEAKERADLLLSISNFTLQHDISAIVMLEQIYRAFTIIKGEPYHR
jgi:23S rRNA (pseudouridine1915-N3)-methyltransferase